MLILEMDEHAVIYDNVNNMYKKKKKYNKLSTYLLLHVIILNKSNNTYCEFHY